MRSAGGELLLCSGAHVRRGRGHWICARQNQRAGSAAEPFRS